MGLICYILSVRQNQARVVHFQLLSSKAGIDISAQRAVLNGIASSPEKSRSTMTWFLRSTPTLQIQLKNNWYHIIRLGLFFLNKNSRNQRYLSSFCPWNDFLLYSIKNNIKRFSRPFMKTVKNRKTGGGGDTERSTFTVL